jgi:hypothetical protein
MGYVAEGRHKTHNREVDCYFDPAAGEYDVRVASSAGIYKSVLKTTDARVAEDKFYSLVDMPGYSKGSWYGIQIETCLFYGCNQPVDKDGACAYHNLQPA